MNTTFNPAFVDVTNMSDRAIQRMGHEDDVRPSSGPFVGQNHRLAIQRGNIGPHPMVGALRAAAVAFDRRRDSFALGKAATCADLADKLERFGSFVSEKQEQFAQKLVEWSKPREQQAAAPVPPAAPAQMALPRLFDLMQRLAKLTIGELTIARKNGDSLCWVKVVGRDGVVGKIENGHLSLFAGRINNPLLAGKIAIDLQRIEQDPQAAAVLHGKLSGRCSICSRDLTDPVSIERGIGPICVTKAGW